MPIKIEKVKELYNLICKRVEYKRHNGIYSKNLKDIIDLLSSVDEETLSSMLNKIPDDIDTTFLNLVIKIGDKDLVELFLEHNARVDVKDRNGDFPLHYAAKAGDENIVKIVLGAIAKIPIEEFKPQFNVCNRTALAEALEHIKDSVVRLTIVKLLISGGIDPNMGGESNIPLVIAVTNYILTEIDDGTIKALIDHKANANLGDTPSTNAFLFAANNGSALAYDKLLSCGAIPSAQTVVNMKELALDNEDHIFIKYVEKPMGNLLASAAASEYEMNDGQEHDPTNVVGDVKDQ